MFYIWGTFGKPCKKSIYLSLPWCLWSTIKYLSCYCLSTVFIYSFFFFIYLHTYVCSWVLKYAWKGEEIWFGISGKGIHGRKMCFFFVYFWWFVQHFCVDFLRGSIMRWFERPGCEWRRLGKTIWTTDLILLRKISQSLFPRECYRGLKTIKDQNKKGTNS